MADDEGAVADEELGLDLSNLPEVFDAEFISGLGLNELIALETADLTASQRASLKAADEELAGPLIAAIARLDLAKENAELSAKMRAMIEATEAPARKARQLFSGLDKGSAARDHARHLALFQPLREAVDVPRIPMRGEVEAERERARVERELEAAELSKTMAASLQVMVDIQRDAGEKAERQWTKLAADSRFDRRIQFAILAVAVLALVVAILG